MARGRIAGLSAAVCVLAALFSAGSAAAAGGEFHGTVTDPLGEPIEGITVCAEGLSPVAGSECYWTTDAHGGYSIGNLPAAAYRIGFHVESNPSLNYVQQWHSGKAHPEEADPIQLAEGESREINAQMQTGGQFRGTVADQKTGLPIEGVQVCALQLGFFQTGETGYCGRSNAAGEFAVKNLGTGEYRLEFNTEGQVNYVEELLPEPPGSIPLTAPGVIEVEASLLPGIQIEGALTESGTGAPIFNGTEPYSSVPAVCALNPTTEARIKCAAVGLDGHYSIAGLPAGTYAVSFAVDNVEEGMNLHPDGYVRRYWQEVPNFGEATLLAGTAGTVFDGIDAILTRGAEVFPNCEVPSACPPPFFSGETPPAGGAYGPTPPPPRAKPPIRRPRCKKGFRRAKKNGRPRCVKIKKKHQQR